MNVAALKRMRVPQFLAWAERQPRGRYELVHGVPVAMAPQRSEHAETKFFAEARIRIGAARPTPCPGAPPLTLSSRSV